MIALSESRSPNYLNTLLIASVVFFSSTPSKGWQKFEAVHLGTVAIKAGFDPQIIFLK